MASQNTDRTSNAQGPIHSDESSFGLKHVVAGKTNNCKTNVTLNYPFPIKGKSSSKDCHETGTKNINGTFFSTGSFNSHKKIDATTRNCEISAVEEIAFQSKVNRSYNSTYKYDGDHTGTIINNTKTVYGTNHR